jgi:Mg-chelatase subunit ChlD
MGSELDRFKKGIGLVNKRGGKDALNRLRSSALRPSVGYQEALVLVIDYSASMSAPETSGVRRIDAVKSAVDGLLADCTKGATRIAVVKFSDSGVVVTPLTPKYELVQEGMDTIEPYAGTFVTSALQIAQQILDLQDVRVKRMIVLSDGEAADVAQALVWAKNDRTEGTIIDTVYFNNVSYGEDLMVQLADISGGKFTRAGDAKQLATTFKALEAKTRGLLGPGGQ